MNKCIVFLAFGFISCIAAASDGPVIISTSYEAVYIPKGFDTNDNVQLMGEGTFPSSCFKISQPNVQIDEVNLTILLDPQAYSYNGGCEEFEIPFQQEVNLGIIQTPGEYSIISPDGKALGKVDVKQATSNRPDDYFYAPVQGIALELNSQNTLTVRMEFKTRCVQLDEIRVEKQENVIVILPIAKVVERLTCRNGDYPVSGTIDIGPLATGRYLLHVRSSGSQAINQLVTVE